MWTSRRDVAGGAEASTVDGGPQYNGVFPPGRSRFFVVLTGISSK